MDIVPYDQFLDIVSTTEELYIQKLKLGFVPNNVCDTIKEMYAIMCLHFLQNKDVFNDERKTAVNNIINLITNG